MLSASSDDLVQKNLVRRVDRDLVHCAAELCLRVARHAHGVEPLWGADDTERALRRPQMASEITRRGIGLEPQRHSFRHARLARRGALLKKLGCFHGAYFFSNGDHKKLVHGGVVGCGNPFGGLL
jgi:hypothetical protein